MEPFVRSAYNYDAVAVGNETGLDCSIVPDGEEKFRTKQSFAEECDINTIVRRFDLTGQLPENVRTPQVGDFTTVRDFRSAMEAVRLARESFDEMPADIRAKFGNDPAAFVDFCADQENVPQMLKWGLAVPSEALAAAMAAKATAPAAPPPPASQAKS